ncbi:hypothetical protein [uncultured Sphingomonas sp.]|uniref:hypothetical protein n=1 Tax=uncultured Sphingomonas sp. TaxID=158754 RepID=UPI0025DF50F3|nr:hypothetical protein [uncultured Sphingomonas sp.]
MFGKLYCAAMVLLAGASAAHSAEPDAAPIPASVSALTGCWEGRGEVMSKPVVIFITAYPIVRGAMVALEAASSAIADPQDQYAAHLVFGGSDKQPGSKVDHIVGYWADSFGGAFAATGQGESRADGFDITYHYPDDAFVNRWRFSGDQLTWRIVARDGKGAEKPFASYAFHKTACRSSTDPR